MMTTLFRSREDGELHATGPVDWTEDSVPAACQNVAAGTTDDLETTRADPTCPDCQEIGPKFELSDDWNDDSVEAGSGRDE